MTWRLRLHPQAAADIDAILDAHIARSEPASAARRLDEIEAAFASLRLEPRRGTTRDEILPGLRAVPAGRRTEIAFVVDEATHEIRVLAVAYAGAEWARRILPRGAQP